MSILPRIYNPGPIEAVVDAGQNVLLVSTGSYQLYKVLYVEPLPEGESLTVDLLLPATGRATLAGGAIGAQVSLTSQIDMNDGEVAQIRFHVLDDFMLQLFQLAGVRRNVLRNSNAVFTAYSRFIDPYDAASEHFVLAQNRSYMTPVNIHAATLNQARVALYGFRYVLEGGTSTVAGNTQAGIGGKNIQPIISWPSLDQALAWRDSQQGQKFTIMPIVGWGS